MRSDTANEHSPERRSRVIEKDASREERSTYSRSRSRSVHSRRRQELRSSSSARKTLRGRRRRRSLTRSRRRSRTRSRLKRRSRSVHARRMRKKSSSSERTIARGRRRQRNSSCSRRRSRSIRTHRRGQLRSSSDDEQMNSRGRRYERSFSRSRRRSRSVQARHQRRSSRSSSSEESISRGRGTRRISRPRRVSRRKDSKISRSYRKKTTKIRKRKENVSDYSLIDSESESSVSNESRLRKRKQSEQNFSANDVMELLRSLPASTSQNHFSMSTNTVPEFDPSNKEQTINIWIKKVEECSLLYNWSETQLLHYSLPKLSGVAKVWYQGLPSVNFTWAEWKEKLIKTFPTVQNYAQLLHEMLDRKVKVNEDLETYFYHKMILLNRCGIFGKQAIDCVIYGLEDRSMRLGAQAANYSEPEELLSYFKSVKVDDGKDRRVIFKKKSEFLGENNTKTTAATIKCFNCGEVGHPSFKCSKPLISCNICKRLGHLASACRRLQKNIIDDKNTIDKSVSEVKLAGNLDDKYVLPILVNNKPKTCYIDLGSQCTLIKLSDFNELGVEYLCTKLPSLKGFGDSLISPIGKAIVNLKVQGVSVDTEVLIVQDSLLKYSILLGHTFTEQSGITIIKTDEQLIIHKRPLNNERPRLNLKVDADIEVQSISAVPIKADTETSCNFYVDMVLRNIHENMYYIMPGIYTLVNGSGFVIIANLGSSVLKFKKKELLVRPIIYDDDKPLEVRKLDSSNFKLTPDQIKTGESVSSEDKIRLETLLQKYSDCFSFGLSDLGLTNLTEMTITLSDQTPVVYRPYRLAHSEREIVKAMIKEMLDSGIITESASSYASPILLVQKKTGDKRLCVDYRALNSKTIKEHYPLPRVEDQIDNLRGYKYFITLDLASGYYQIPIAPTSQNKTAFVTPDGQYEFTRMPFGLANAPSIFQKTINKMLKSSKDCEAYAFMDDIIIPANSINEGMERLEKVLKLIRDAGLTLKVSKCMFFFTTIDYLGFEISQQGVRPGSRKIEAVDKFKVPKNQHEVRQFVGLLSFFRRFVKDFAILASPLTKLELKKNVAWQWGSSQQEAFDTLKAALINRPILAMYDPKAKTQIHTDACKTGIGGMLLQQDDHGRWRAVAYYSRQTTAEEQKYHSFELETLAVIASLNRFRVYVLGLKFTIVTDCNALRTTLTKRDVIPRIGRWWLQLQEYNCDVEYRPGSRMSHVDALSRNAIPIDDEPEPVFDVLAIESEDWLITMQNANEEIQNIKRVLEDPDTKNAVDIHQNYKIKNGKIYRLVEGQLRWLVPRGVRWQLLQKNHDELGHFGLEKTLDKLKDLYWFPKMRKFVKKYVQSCLECSYHKVPAGKRQGLLHPIPKINEPFHTVHLDHLGPFVKSKNKNVYILVLIDAYTKYISLYAVKSTKTKATIKVLNNYFSLFGVPCRLISDRGTSFTSKIFKEFVNKLGIRHVLNAVATPRANGQVERFNRTILASLATKNHNHQENEWDIHLEDIQLGLNTTINKTTGKSPSEVLFGLRFRTKGDGIVSSLLDCERGKTELSEIRNQVNERVAQEQRRQKERFDKGRKSVTLYKVGDLVRIEREVTNNSGKSKKLLPKLQGPYRIIKVLDKDRFVVEDTPLTRKQNRRYEGVISIDKIHPWMTFTQGYLSDSDKDRESNGDDSDLIDENSLATKDVEASNLVDNSILSDSDKEIEFNISNEDVA
ncbi:hypothetical protein ABMA28_001773 [Loxostege sticticalis]|uniref:RNA-directed DNA polymerase n=1 Tax=Loxostege sticticalis TaxID=481309 RepID=A0ABD0T356_LOXSC